MTSEPLNPEKYHVLDKRKKAIAIGLLAFLVIILIPLFGFAYYKFAVTRPNQTADELTIEVHGGETVTEIGSRLYEQDVINSEFLFKFYLVLNNLEDDIQAGLYVIPSGTSIAELATILQHGTNDTTITFLEGWRMEEFARKASMNYDKIDYSDFVNEARTHEGYLFPDTYSFSSEVTEKEMVNKLTATFEEKTKDVLTKDALKTSGLTLEEVLTFASIVEREVNSEEDRPIVAGILIKRWQDGELIGADATTQYIAGPHRYGCPIDNVRSKVICPDIEEVPNVNWWPNDLTQDELDFENPYNTRKVPGLPPKPIANPSISSINAVLSPQTTTYYFYLTDDKGITHYAETVEEHNQNILDYLR